MKVIISQYKLPDGSIDFNRLAKVNAGWCNASERSIQTEAAMKAVYQQGKRDGRKAARS